MSRPYFKSPLALAIVPILVGSIVTLSSCTNTSETSQPTSTPVAQSPTPEQSPQTQPTKAKTSSKAEPLTAGVEGADRPGADPLDLMQNSQIKKELNISDEQSTELKQIAEDFRAGVSQIVTGLDLKKLDPQQREQKISEITDKMKQQIQEAREKVGKTLKPEQLKRFKEITLQIYGFGALSFDQFTDDLKLTSDQQKKLNDIRDRLGINIRKNLEVPNGTDAESLKKAIAANRKRTEQILKESNQQAVAVLTPEQQKVLETLRGKEFKLEATQPQS